MTGVSIGRASHACSIEEIRISTNGYSTVHEPPSLYEIDQILFYTSRQMLTLGQTLKHRLSLKKIAASTIRE